MVAAMIVAIVAIFVLKDDGDDISQGEAVGAGAPAAAQQVQTEPISTATDPFAPPGQVGQDLAVTPVQTAAPTTASLAASPEGKGDGKRNSQSESLGAVVAVTLKSAAVHLSPARQAAASG